MPGNFTGWNLKYAMHQHDLKKLVKKGAAEGREYERQLIKENESKLLEEIKAVGVAVIDVDKKPFQEKTKAGYAEFEPVLGKDIIDMALKQ